MTPCKARRIEARRRANKGSDNVRQKRARYKRWQKLTPKQRDIAHRKGQNQFLPKKEVLSES